MKATIVVVLAILVLCNTSCRSFPGSKYDSSSIMLHYVTQKGLKRVVDLRNSNEMKGANGELVGVIGEFAGLIPGRKALIKDRRIYAGRETFKMLEIDINYIKKHKNVMHILGYVDNSDGNVFLDPWIMPTRDVIP